MNVTLPDFYYFTGRVESFDRGVSYISFGFVQMRPLCSLVFNWA